jgi:Ca-activated chloride channel family protein
MLVAEGGGMLEIEQHDVQVTLNDGIAVTRVTQVFRNTEDPTVEALYSFPVPANASVAGFSLWINGREMIGEVVEKQAAREIYGSYKAAQRDPGLLEQADYRTFHLRVFPILAHALQKVQVTYYQELESDGPWVTYVYPLSSNTAHAVNSRVSKSFTLTADVKSADPLRELRSPSHAKSATFTRYSQTYARASIAAEGGGLDRDVVLAYRTDVAASSAQLIADRQADSDGYFCLRITAGNDLAPAKEAGDYVFLLDVSASMRDDQKLGESRGTLSALVDLLSPDDRFDVIAFNNASSSIFGALAPANDDNRKRAGEFLQSRSARGGTDFGAALAAAYRYAQPGHPLNIVLISDGLSEQNRLAALMRQITSRPAGSRILCVGVGNDVDRPLLQRLADQTGGLAAFTSADDDFGRQAQSLRRKLRQPALTDVSVQIDGVGVRDVEPERLARAIIYLSHHRITPIFSGCISPKNSKF